MNKLARHSSSYLLFLLFCTFSGCAPKAVPPLAVPAPVEPEVVAVGGDRDPDGCIPSAGYTWSSARKTCIRPWEEGISMHNTLTPENTLLAYLVPASEQVFELFLPGGGDGIVLNQQGDRWVDSQNLYIIKREAGAVYVLQNNEGVQLFKSQDQ